MEVTSRTTKCKRYYFYYNDGEFGWMFLRIQTWFPYNVQIYLNGHEYLSKLLKSEGIPYSMYNNSFSFIEDFDRAQEMADRVLRKKLFDETVRVLSTIASGDLILNGFDNKRLRQRIYLRIWYN